MSREALATGTGATLDFVFMLTPRRAERILNLVITSDNGSYVWLGGSVSVGHAVALHFMHCNFARRHKTMTVSPAMTAGVIAFCFKVRAGS